MQIVALHLHLKGYTMSKPQVIRKALLTLISQLLLLGLTLAAHAGSGGGTRVVDNPGPGSAVPEPSALLAFATGALLIGYAIRRRRS